MGLIKLVEPGQSVTAVKISFTDEYLPTIFFYKHAKNRFFKKCFLQLWKAGQPSRYHGQKKMAFWVVHQTQLPYKVSSDCTNLVRFHVQLSIFSAFLKILIRICCCHEKNLIDKMIDMKSNSLWIFFRLELCSHWCDTFEIIQYIFVLIRDSWFMI